MISPKIVYLLSLILLITVSFPCGPIQSQDNLQTGYYTILQPQNKDHTEYQISIRNFTPTRKNTKIFVANQFFRGVSLKDGVAYNISGILDPIVDRLRVVFVWEVGFLWKEIRISYLVSQSQEYLVGQIYKENPTNFVTETFKTQIFAPLTSYKALAYISGLKTTQPNFNLTLISTTINNLTGKLLITFPTTSLSYITISYIIYQQIHDKFSYFFGNGGTYQLSGIKSMSQELISQEVFSICRKDFQSFCVNRNQVSYNGRCICKDQSKRMILTGGCIGECAQNQVLTSNGCQCIKGYVNIGAGCVKKTECSTNQIYNQVKNTCECEVGYQIIMNSNDNKCIKKCGENQERVSGQCTCKNQYYKDNNNINGLCVIKPACPSGAQFNITNKICICINTNEHIIQKKCQPCGKNQKWNGNQCVCIDDAHLIEGNCFICDINAKYKDQDCICNDGYYGTRQLCTKCHISCKTCSGPNPNNCLTCQDNTYQLVNQICRKIVICEEGSYRQTAENVCQKCSDKCLSCKQLEKCQKCQVGYYVSENSGGKCVPKCGDGIKLKLEQCDDGNIIDGDGCNKMCRIQDRWQCDENSPSNCLKPKLFLIQKDKISFPQRTLLSLQLSNYPECFQNLSDPTQIGNKLLIAKITNDYKFVTIYVGYDAFLTIFNVDFVFNSARPGDRVEYQIGFNVQDAGNDLVRECLGEVDVMQVIKGELVYSF